MAKNKDGKKKKAAAPEAAPVEPEAPEASPVSEDDAKAVEESESSEEAQKEAEEAERIDREIKLSEDKGVLMLRFFKKDDRTGKILTRLHRKVFFPVDPNLEPGWYIATIVGTHKTHGVMDVMPLDKVPIHLWKPQHIRGIFIERDHKENKLKIFPAIPREYLDEQEPTCVHEVALPEPKFKKGATIGEIIAAKASDKE
jgi:hypothetical protein